MVELKRNGTLRRRCCHRPVQYLNNIVEQDHRVIRKRVNATGLPSVWCSETDIQGYEAMHMLRKGQVQWVAVTDVRAPVQFTAYLGSLCDADAGTLNNVVTLF